MVNYYEGGDVAVEKSSGVRIEGSSFQAIPPPLPHLLLCVRVVGSAVSSPSDEMKN